MAATNSTIMAKLWLAGTNDFQQRIPEPTQQNIAQVFKAITAPQNAMLWNQFMDGFVNLIGNQRIHTASWNNPLERFIDSQKMYGSSIQESALQWIKAHSYADDAQDLLKIERPVAEVAYHSLNFQNKYPISVNRDELMMAFRDEYGLNRLINQITTVPLNSARYDTYLAMMQLIAEYEENWGFYKHQLSLPPTDETTGKELLTALRSYAAKLRFPSTVYNAGIIDIPMFAEPNELVWITTADYAASVDVNTLSAVFQLDKAEVNYTTIIVPELPVANAIGLLTTEDFFVCQKQVDTMGSFYDPNTLTTKYIYHLWQIISASPFVPAILFTTDAGTEVTTVTQEVTSLNLSSDTNTVELGGTATITPTLNGTLTPEAEGVEIAPDSCTWEVSLTDTDASGSTLNSRTYVDSYGVLHVQKSSLTSGDVLTVTATSTYINPSGATPALSATITFTVA